jgi:uncharacterized protein YdhG (YjbR/CyaY superfamily)
LGRFHLSAQRHHLALVVKQNESPNPPDIGMFVGNAHSAAMGSREINSDFASPKTIDAYNAGFPKNVQDILQEIRGIIQDAAPEAEEAVKYQIPTFVLNEDLVHCAAFQGHIGFYLTPSGIEQFEDALAAYCTAKGSVQFPLDSPMPYSLIKKIVKFRVKENRDRMAAKSRRKNRSEPS